MRLAAQAKGGFYPTPERVVDLLAELIHTPTGYYHRDRETLRILDPCCGAGEALAQLAERMDAPNAIPIETYGVELHRDRAEEAEKRLGRALASDLFATSVANGAFGLLLLNPPYDYDSEDKRTEHAFLTQTTRYLAEGGLLAFIVPRQRLAVSARYLSTHYGRMRCWAFPHPEREVFDQVVLMGYRKADPVPDAHGESMALEWAVGEPEPMRPEQYPPFTPKTTPSGDILFTTRTVDPVAAAAEARRSGLWASMETTDTLWPARDARTRPLMPLRRGHMAGFKRILVLGPPHLVPKWKREVEMTVPGARAVIVKSITDLERLRLSVGSGPLFAVMSREKANLSYRWMPAVIQRWAVSKGRLLRDEETGEPFRVPCCPDCTAQIVDKDGVPLTGEDLNRRKHTCAGCGSPLWQADKSGPKRYPLSDYVKHRMKGFFDLLVGDEVHEYKGRGSAQGIAAGVLADVCGKSLSLSGTLMGGYSSTLFHLLYRFSPEIRTDFGRSDEHRWIQRYGFEEHTVGKPDDDSVEDGRFSRRRKYRKVVRERPGLVPSALFHIIGNTVFLRLADVASGLPSYEEQVMLSSMDSEEDATGYSQRSAYNTVYEELRLKLAEALKAGSKRLLATYLQTLLAYPDGCTRGETVFDPRSGDVIVQVPPLSEEKLYPKEKALIDMVAAERMEGRRVLVYATHTGTRDITERMDDMLTRHGFRVAVMKADAVAPERREAWVADRVKQGIDVMICHPRLVQTGLDLIDFPTLIWYETEFLVLQSTLHPRSGWPGSDRRCCSHRW